MKRHPALAPLSRDHHHALVAARKLCRATPEDRDAVATEFTRFWGVEHAHFRVEEELLLPVYAAHGDPRHPAITQMLADHMTIRRDAALVADGAPVETMAALGVQLAAHVRLEEREVFPLVEELVPEAELQALGRRLADAEHRGRIS